MALTDSAALALLAIYALDRAAKAAAVARFFARPAPPEPPAWPSVALIQPVTRGAADLAANLRARAEQDYAGPLRHVIVCDAADSESQAVCRAALPGAAEIVRVVPDSPDSDIASKVVKMTAGVAHARGVDVFCFVDDDIGLPPDGVRTLVTYLGLPRAGAAFGLACHTSWENAPSALLSAFVNANALTGYVPLSLLTEPYTITGHVFALRRADFEAIGGAACLAGRFDDDHEIARQVRGILGLTCVQTPLVYRVANHLPTLKAYHRQMRRWFAMPRVAMLPYLTARERVVTALLSAGNLLPPALLLLALAAPGPVTAACALAAFALFAAGYLRGAQRLPVRLPARLLRWLLPVVAFLTPLHVLLVCLLPVGPIEWRGQKLRLKPDGGFEVLK